MKEYEIYIPLRFNNGDLIPEAIIDEIGSALLDAFGGATFFPQRNKGMWKMGHMVFHDEVVIFRTVSDRVRFARRYFRKLKQRLKRELKQEEIFIVEKHVRVL